ncbi:hypothetical protein [Roseobacter sp. EG26]|uniref:hypothetical protein n=1 Tax=Roseobacter sp. EG26 TaxID=3412477 RepID=UPI003CE46CF0
MRQAEWNPIYGSLEIFCKSQPQSEVTACIKYKRLGPRSAARGAVSGNRGMWRCGKKLPICALRDFKRIIAAAKQAVSGAKAGQALSMIFAGHILPHLTPGKYGISADNLRIRSSFS